MKTGPGPPKLTKILERFCVTDGTKFRLSDYDPADTAGIDLNKAEAKALVARDVERLAALQELLYAQDRWSLLCVLQGMDSGGKDSTIKHVMSGVNPQGVQVSAFKAPGPEELAHGFLWRVSAKLPPRGHIGIFNRSHYEEVLVVRVHPELLQTQRLPEAVIGKNFWRHRLEDIANFERYLAHQGVVILKFFLHISKEEQRCRLLARLEDPRKNWKFSESDLAERRLWDDYMHAYEKAIAATAAPHAPWYIVPADHKWFAHVVVVAALIEALEGLKLSYPKLEPAQQELLNRARAELQAKPD